MTPRREMAFGLGLVVLGAAVALVAGAAGSSGGQAVVPGAPSDGSAGGSGGAASALALVALAGAGAILLVRATGRMLLGVVLLAVGGGIVASGLDPVVAVRLLAGAATVAGSLVVVLRARSWPAPRSRYDTPAPRRGTPRDAWDALDRGEDPTA